MGRPERRLRLTIADLFALLSQSVGYKSLQEAVAGTRLSSPFALPVAASIERGSMMFS